MDRRKIKRGCQTLLIRTSGLTLNQKAMMCLRISGLFCALVWLFYYAEIRSPPRIPVFDYGVPLISVLALILPVLALFVWSQRLVLMVGVWALSVGLGKALPLKRLRALGTMPRNTRIDAPGALHHIIVRGIERRRIFSNDQDRDNFKGQFSPGGRNRFRRCLHVKSARHSSY
jgi:hypothetical protein